MKTLSEIAKFIGFEREKNLLKEILDKCSVNKMKEEEKKRDTGTPVANSEFVSNLYRKGQSIVC